MVLTRTEGRREDGGICSHPSVGFSLTLFWKMCLGFGRTRGRAGRKVDSNNVDLFFHHVSSFSSSLPPSTPERSPHPPFHSCHSCNVHSSRSLRNAHERVRVPDRGGRAPETGEGTLGGRASFGPSAPPRWLSHAISPMSRRPETLRRLENISTMEQDTGPSLSPPFLLLFSSSSILFRH